MVPLAPETSEKTVTINDFAVATMSDPVVAADGHVYDWVAIQEWFQRGNRSSPMTGAPCAKKEKPLRRAIEDPYRSPLVPIGSYSALLVPIEPILVSVGHYWSLIDLH
jgi:hypothetical protein